MRVLHTSTKGRDNVLFAEAYHYESISRGDDIKDEDKNKRFDKEKENLLKLHEDFIKKATHTITQI